MFFPDAFFLWLKEPALEGPVFPLDDAYIHLQLATTLRNSGTWGINANEFVSASSSPAWTILLAIAGPTPTTALLLNLISAIFLLFFCGALFSRARWLWLPILTLLTPLPFLVGLGMEHTLHATLAVALLWAVENKKTPLFVAILSGCAVLARYESMLLVLLLAPGRWKTRPMDSLALVAGALGSTGLFGLFSVASGGSFLPNSILKKAGPQTWEAAWHALQECPSLGILSALALVIAWNEQGFRRERALIITGVIVGQLWAGRVGWLYRYEAWLVVLGLVVVGGWRHGWKVLPLLLPLFFRMEAANNAFAPGVVFTRIANQEVGNWVRTLPDIGPVVVHDLGAISYFGQKPVIDVGGLGTETLARAYRNHTQNTSLLDTYFRNHHAQLAITGAQWPLGQSPSDAVAVARIFVPYPAGLGEFEVVFWALTPEAVMVIEQHLPTVWPGGRVLRRGGLEAMLDEASIQGQAVVHEEGGITFYTNGEAQFLAPGTGRLVLAGWGSTVDRQGPIVEVEACGQKITVSFGSTDSNFTICAVQKGEPITLRYANDAQGPSEDRNLYLRRSWVVP